MAQPSRSDKSFRDIKKIVEHTMAILSAKAHKLVEAKSSADSDTCQELKKFKVDFSKYFELLCAVILQLGITPEELFDSNPLTAITKQILVSSRLYELSKWNQDIDTKINELTKLNEQIKLKMQESRRLSETDLEEINKKIKFYQSKGEQYRQEIKKAEAEIKTSGFVADLKEEAIAELRQRNQNLKKDLEVIGDKLSFFDFEPSEEALKERLSKLQNDLDHLNLTGDL